MSNAVERAASLDIATRPFFCSASCFQTTASDVTSFQLSLGDARARSLTTHSAPTSSGSPSPLLTIPVEWIVDICMEDSVWFIGTAYSYVVPASPSAPPYLECVIPDSHSPTWSGDVPLNYLAVRLLECCDASSKALFDELIRSSVIPVDWSVEWTTSLAVGDDDEDEAGEDEHLVREEGDAVYLVRFLNALICRPRQDVNDSLHNHPDGETGGERLIPCDPSLTLVRCHSGAAHMSSARFRGVVDCSGAADFERLVTEGVVDWSGEAPEYAPPNDGEGAQGDGEDPGANGPSSEGGDGDGAEEALAHKRLSSPATMRDDVLTDLTSLYLTMRECMGFALSERERCVSSRRLMVSRLAAYVFGGDLEKGLALMNDLKDDDGGVDLTAEDAQKVADITRVLNEVAREAEEAFSTSLTTKGSLREEIRQMKEKIEELKAERA